MGFLNTKINYGVNQHIKSYYVEIFTGRKFFVNFATYSHW